MISENIIKFISVGFVILWIPTFGYTQNFYKDKIPKTDIFSIGIGPSFIYADNGGPYRSLQFVWDPAISLSYAKKFNNRFAFKTTTGIQRIQGSVSPSIQVQKRWIANNGAFKFKGHAFYADVMPIMYLFPFHSHMNRRFVNLYGGLGIGLLHVNRKETYSTDLDAIEMRASATTGYIPLRAGISFRLGTLSDLALEGTMLFTFSDNLDGNQNSNSFGDHLAQAQLVYKKFLNPRSKK